MVTATAAAGAAFSPIPPQFHNDQYHNRRHCRADGNRTPVCCEKIQHLRFLLLPYTLTFVLRVLLSLYGRKSINRINATMAKATMEPMTFPLPVNSIPS